MFLLFFITGSSTDLTPSVIGYYDKNINNNNTSKAKHTKELTSNELIHTSLNTNKAKFQVLSPGLQRLIAHSDNSSDEKPEPVRNTSSLFPTRPPRKIGATSTPTKTKHNQINIPLSKGTCKLSQVVHELKYDHNSTHLTINDDNLNNSEDELKTPTNANTSFLFRSTSVKSNHSSSSNNSSTPDINDNSLLNYHPPFDADESIDQDNNFRNIIQRLESITSTSSKDSSADLHNKMSCVPANKPVESDSDDYYQESNVRESQFFVSLPSDKKSLLKSSFSKSMEKISKSKSKEKLTNSPSPSKKSLEKSSSKSTEKSPSPTTKLSIRPTPPSTPSPPSSPTIGDRSTVIFKGTPLPSVTSDKDDDHDNNTTNSGKLSPETSSPKLSYSKQRALGTSPKSTRRNLKDHQSDPSSSTQSLNNAPSSPIMSTLKLPLKHRPLSAASVSSTSSSSSSGSENSSGKNVVSYMASVESLEDHSENELSNGTFTMVERAAMELIESERSYVVDLGQIINGYLNEWREGKLLPEEELKILFNNIEEVFAFNKILLEELVNCGLDPVKIAKCFIDLKDQFIVYTQYW